MQTVSLPEWRYHGDIAHPEDPSLNDADWPAVKTRVEWKTGARVLRRLIEIPEKLNGYAVRGARVKLEILFTSSETMTITVFSNGSLVERGDEDTQQPILLTENAQPGQQFLIAVRVDNTAVGTQMYRSQLILEAAPNRPDSTFVRDITITAGSPRVDVNMTADWHEKHVLLKVAVPSSAHNEKATFEIPYGSIERPTTRNTLAEKAKFEVPALHWADVSDATHGVSLLNDCKYGYDAKGNVLRLSLLRSPEWPGPHADEGRHEFTYSIYPHGGSWRDALTVRRGYELNYPLLVRPLEKHEGELKDEYSFLQLQPDNVVLTAAKKAEDGNWLILRFYEWAGKESDVKLRLPAGALEASETDLMERRVADLSLVDGAVTIHTKPYEIKTIRVRFTSKSSARAPKIVTCERPLR